jgi:N6-adenosine-specific RNA methylase IME4
MKRYRTIVADPPWPCHGMRRANVLQGDHYRVMTLDEIKALPVGDLAEEDAHLYCWAVLPLMAEAYDVVRAWGFAPITLLTWCKPGPGLGGGFRGNTEHLIVARRGEAFYKPDVLEVRRSRSRRAPVFVLASRVALPRRAHGLCPSIRRRCRGHLVRRASARAFRQAGLVP